jgi:hypothetical protein
MSLAVTWVRAVCVDIAVSFFSASHAAQPSWNPGIMPGQGAVLKSNGVILGAAANVVTAEVGGLNISSVAFGATFGVALGAAAGLLTNGGDAASGLVGDPDGGTAGWSIAGRGIGDTAGFSSGVTDTPACTI